MYTLYWCPMTGSLAPMAMLEEIGAAYELDFVDTAAGAHKADSYRRQVHPLGLVPALALPDGRVAFESAGITAYLAELHPDRGLAPAATSPDRPFYLQWMFYFADTLYPGYQHIYHCERFSADPADAEKIQAQARRTLRTQWQVVEDALTGRDWLVGDGCTAADVYMLMLTTWEENPADFARSFPEVQRVADAAAARPAVRRAVERHAAPGA